MKFVILLTIIFSTASQAQDSARERIEKLLEATNVPQSINAKYSNLAQGVNLAIDQFSDELKKHDELKTLLNRIFQEAQSKISWENMKEPLIDIYQSQYSDKEIKDMLTFFQSESGSSLMENRKAVASDIVVWTVKNAALFKENLDVAKSELEAEIQQKRAEQ